MNNDIILRKLARLQADGRVTAQFQGVRLAIHQGEVRHDG